MKKILIQKPEAPIDSSLHITGSKSISNRALLIRALSGENFRINNLSKSDDTAVLERSLNSKGTDIYDVHHAGTSFRFLTAYLAISKGTQILTGSERMKQRPIGPLVEALRSIGCNIEYVENEGYPPLRIKNFENQVQNKIEIKADISSQFISALCLIAPNLPNGLQINFIGELVSKPYLKMTLKMMVQFGIKSYWENNSVKINHQQYASQEYTVESDWSSASYPISIASTLKHSKLDLSLLYDESLQGDRQIASLISSIGSDIVWHKESISISQKDQVNKEIVYDFIEQPDMFQTIAVLAAVHGIKLKAKGLKTLAIKETDRVNALNTEFNKVGLSLVKSKDSDYEIELHGHLQFDGIPEFNTYQDHRMAMALSIFACVHDVIIVEPEVVSKSYPTYWEHIKKLGFTVKEI